MSECFQFKNIFFYYFPKIFAGKENGGGGSHPSIFTPDSHWTWPRLAAIKQIENNYMRIFFCLSRREFSIRFQLLNNCREQNINFVENIFDGKLQLWIDPKTSNTVDQLNPNLDICGVYNKYQTNTKLTKHCGRIEKTS